MYSEGCLSIPELYVDILRPNQVLVRGFTVDGDEVEIEADELMGRMFQHEIDHLNGVLMFDRMTPDQRKEAMAEYRRLQETPAARRSAARLRLTRERRRSPTSARRPWRCRRCGRWSPPATTSRSWSPGSTSAAAAAAS